MHFLDVLDTGPDEDGHSQGPPRSTMLVLVVDEASDRDPRVGERTNRRQHARLPSSVHQLHA